MAIVPNIFNILLNDIVKSFKKYSVKNRVFADMAHVKKTNIYNFSIICETCEFVCGIMIAIVQLYLIEFSQCYMC